jgi:hypothetical protein
VYRNIDSLRQALIQPSTKRAVSSLLYGARTRLETLRLDSNDVLGIVRDFRSELDGVVRPTTQRTDGWSRLSRMLLKLPSGVSRG